MFRRVVREMSNGAPVGQGLLRSPLPKVAPLPVQSVTAAPVLPSGPGSLWHWLGQLPDPRDPRGVRFSLPCVIAIAMAARLAGRDSFTAAGEWSASRPQRVLRALGCPRHKRARVYVAPSEKTIRRVSGLCDHDLADDLLCGWTGELAAACEGPVPGKGAGTAPGQGPQGQGQGPQGRQA